MINLLNPTSSLSKFRMLRHLGNLPQDREQARQITKNIAKQQVKSVAKKGLAKGGKLAAKGAVKGTAIAAKASFLALKAVLAFLFTNPVGWAILAILLMMGVFFLFGPATSGAAMKAEKDSTPIKQEYIDYELQTYTPEPDDEEKNPNHSYKDEYELRVPKEIFQYVQFSAFYNQDNLYYNTKTSEIIGNIDYMNGNLVYNYDLAGFDVDEYMKVNSQDFMEQLLEDLKPEYFNDSYVNDIYKTYSWEVVRTVKRTGTRIVSDGNGGTKEESYTYTEDKYGWKLIKEKEVKRHKIPQAISWEGTFKRNYEQREIIEGVDREIYDQVVAGTYEGSDSTHPSGSTFTFKKVWTFTTVEYNRDYAKLLSVLNKLNENLTVSSKDNIIDEVNFWLGRIEEDLPQNIANTSLSAEEIEEIKQLLPSDLDENRHDIVMKAYELLGKVEYFWGGKHYGLGWHSDWGKLKQVTSPGSRSTGNYEPFGLDCSGYVSWVFNNTFEKGYKLIGDGSTNQLGNCTQIPKEELLPGDLVFIRSKENPNRTTHVGIVAGRDSKGEIYVIHENARANNISVNGIDIFNIYARPNALNY